MGVSGQWWRFIPRRLWSIYEVPRRLSDRSGHQDARRNPPAQFRSRVPRRKQTRSPAASTKPGLNVTAADPRRTDTYLKADVTPGTCVIVEDTGRRSLKRIIEAIRDAGGTLIYVLGVGISDFRNREEELKSQFPELNYLALSELFGGPLLTEFSRSLTRLKCSNISDSSAMRTGC